MGTAVATKQVQVLARVEFKDDARKVVYFNRSSDGKTQYETSLFDGKATGCNCPAVKPCYHMIQCEQIEALRTAHIAVHGSIAGFVFVAPVTEKPARKTREYEYEAPENIEAMQKLVTLHGATTSRGKLAGLNARFASLVDEQGIIEVEDVRWYFDVDTKCIFEVVPQLSAEVPDSVAVVSEECPQDAYIAGDVDVSEFAADPAEEQEFSEEVAKQWVEEAIAEEPAQVIARVHECLRELSYVCDGAREEDGMGFNGCDAAFGHELAARRELTPKQVLAAAKMLKKYNRSQLGGRVPSVAIVERALSPKAPHDLPKAPTFANVDYSQRGNLNGSNQGFTALDILKRGA